MTRIALVHGLGGSASTMSRLASALNSAGHDAVAITLPGHATQPNDLVKVTWRDWLDAIPVAEVLVGQSMGASLVLAAAAERPSVAGVVCINPLAPDVDSIEGLDWRLSRGHDWVEALAAAEGEQAYDRLPLPALLQMAIGVAAIDYATIHQPVLLITSADDDMVDPASSDLVASMITGPVTRLTLGAGGHTASLGLEVDTIVAAIVAHLAAPGGRENST